jgi:hypothetical protein
LKERERENREEGARWEKGKEAGGQGQNALLPPLARIQNRGRGLGRWWTAGLPGTAVDGERGRRRRASRGSFSLPHLELGCAAKVDQWAAADCRLGSSGGGVVECRGEGGCLAAVQGEVGSRAGLFIGAGRRFGEKIFPAGGSAGGGAMTGLEWRRNELLVQAR